MIGIGGRLDVLHSFNREDTRPSNSLMKMICFLNGCRQRSRIDNQPTPGVQTFRRRLRDYSIPAAERVAAMPQTFELTVVCERLPNPIGKSVWRPTTPREG